ncbi:proton-conducting transporter membrane subunit [Rhodopseudomonas palustris]|uniref:complex I subunit 5 family protein n=1 Tax=Rhodopseudomonas palustris TaxID=1076 RepID=UPI002ACEB0BD|nr:proton-conducting transporter membrane subunit [Rhodopseudomonas palustris]WQG99783.1 proton-conducting transporter membrane subunit [Rhodopseudomonas palustris]
MTEFVRVLLPLAPAVPLVLALLGLLLRRPTSLLPLAALPGLAAAFVSPTGEIISLPWLLLGISFRLDPLGAVFLGFASLLWTLAGLYAYAYLGGKQGEGRFCLFWNLTLAGTSGTFVAADAATFYLSFALLSLAAYGLVVHERSKAAWRAGRVYIVLAIFGETCLLLGLLLGANAADSLLIDDVRAALAVSPWRDAAILALLMGFGLKAGLVPLHVWLPLAHSAAPVPASAVLSGVIVKAGLIGLIRFLPIDALPSWADTLLWLGLATAWSGILLGLPQRQPKAVLAYSTMSQMGLMVAVLGAGFGAGVAGTTMATALYATHHGLAKGALFLAVGVVAAGAGRAAIPLLVVVAVLGAAIAGMPFTGGALAKLAIKDSLGSGPVGLLASLSAIGTMLLMLRTLVLLVAQRPPAAVAHASAGLIGPFVATAAAALVVPWLLFPVLTGRPLAYAFASPVIWDALWPIFVAVVIASPAFLRSIAVGDIAGPVEAVLRRVGGSWTAWHPPRPAIDGPRLLTRLVKPAQSLETWLAGSAASGSALLLVAVLLGFAALI